MPEIYGFDFSQGGDVGDVFFQRFGHVIYLLAKEAGIADSNAFDLRLPWHLLMFDILKSHFKLPCRFWILQPVLNWCPYRLMISLILLKYPQFAGKK